MRKVSLKYNDDKTRIVKDDASTRPDLISDQFERNRESAACGKLA